MSPNTSELHVNAARLRLELASTSEERRHAVAGAVALGMPLWQIEQYLDWLDASHAYQTSMSHAPTWMNRLSTGMLVPVRAGIDVLRRLGRRLLDSANPA